jgi:hypothetical protein
LLHTAAACAHAAANIPSVPKNWEQAALARLFAPSRPLAAHLPGKAVDCLFDRLVADVSSSRALSLLPISLTGSEILFDTRQVA